MNSSKSVYKKMKNFEEIYRKEGAYHVVKNGFNSWWLNDNYKLIASKIKNKNSLVLDFACGDGKLSEYIGNPIIGIDNSPTSLKLNKKFYPNRYQKLMLADMRNLKPIFAKINKVDVIVCSLSFMYLIPKDLDACLKGLRKILRSEGKLIFTYPNVSRKRPANPTSAELKYSTLKIIVKKAGYKNITRYNICPLIPKFIVNLSNSWLFPLAKLYYIILKRIKVRNNENAYHYMVVADY